MGYHVLHHQQHNELQDSSSCSNKAFMPIKTRSNGKRIQDAQSPLVFEYSFCNEVFKDAAQES